jgi:hypothetical protein
MAIRSTSVVLGALASAALALGASAQAPPRDPRAGRGPEDPILKSWAVYDQYCVACHGRNLEGGAAGSLVDGVWKFGGEDAQIAETIRDGRKGTAMASFKPVLTEDQIWRLLIRYGRVRDVVTGPDGLLYVALQLPGVKLSSSTPGVVVRLVPIE